MTKVRNVNIDFCWSEHEIRPDLTADIRVVPVYKSGRKQDVEYTIRRMQAHQLAQLARQCMLALTDIRNRTNKHIDSVRKID